MIVLSRQAYTTVLLLMTHVETVGGLVYLRYFKNLQVLPYHHLIGLLLVFADYVCDFALCVSENSVLVLLLTRLGTQGRLLMTVLCAMIGRNFLYGVQLLF